MEPYLYTDESGDSVAIRPDASTDLGRALVDCDPSGSHPPVAVPAHELARFTAALYEAAGQPAPDLPVIPDQAELHRLAEVIRYAITGTSGAGSPIELRYARVLLAHGVRCPEPS
jgi:hypothetical protein